MFNEQYYNSSHQTVTASKILAQVEFYFSNLNLPHDIFLQSQIDAHPEGFVPLDTLLRFQMIKRIFHDAGGIDGKVLCVAHMASALASSTKLEVSQDKLSVRIRGFQPQKSSVREEAKDGDDAPKLPDENE